MSTTPIGISGTSHDVPVVPDVRINYVALNKKRPGSTYTVKGH